MVNYTRDDMISGELKLGKKLHRQNIGYKTKKNLRNYLQLAKLIPVKKNTLEGTASAFQCC